MDIKVKITEVTNGNGFIKVGIHADSYSPPDK